MAVPPTRRSDDRDTFYGVDVPDPYRWLEDLDSEETRTWIAAQNAHASVYVDRPRREAIRGRLIAAFDHERRSAPRAYRGGVRWYRRHDPLADQALLIREVRGQAPEIVIDPNTLSADGTRAMTMWTVSHDGRRVAHAVAEAGSDWVEWRIRDVDTGEDLPDVIARSKFGQAQWLGDDSGLIYVRFGAPSDGVDLGMEVCLHRLGAPPDTDLVVVPAGLGGSGSAGMVWPAVTPDGSLVVVLVKVPEAQGHQLWVVDLVNGTPAGPPRALVDHHRYSFTALGSRGREIFVLTDADAPRRRVVAIDVDSPTRWREVVAEHPEDTLSEVQLTGGRLFCLRIHHCTTQAVVFDLDGVEVGMVEIPAAGGVGGFAGGPDTDEVFFEYDSFTTPSTLYRYDIATHRSEVHHRCPIQGIDVDDLHTTQIFVRSPDGTRVPAFLLYKGDLPSTPRPTVLYGYGGFNAPMLPIFRPHIAVWLQLGGVFVVANLRGGGEYGKEWHEAGTKMQKQNVFDDFIAVAEHLIASGIATVDTLAIHGRSNGGLLVGAALIQRPDLFAAAIPAVGVLDLLRYHRFTIGWAWASDYGTVEDDEAMFRYLLKISPLHNTTPASYPATLILTGDHDDRVVPAHSYKFAAALQAAQRGEAPVLLRVDLRAGHGPGKPVAMEIEESADMFTFLAEALGLPS